MKLRWSDGESERQRVHDEEEGQVALRVGGVDVERVALAAGAERDRGHANEQHDEGHEHERRAEDRADADLVGVRAIGENDRDDRDERFGCRGAERGEDASGGTRADPQLDAEPLDPVRKDLGADEDEHERAHDEREVDGAHQSSGEVDTPSSVVATARSRPAALRASTVRASGMRTRTAASARTTIASQLEKK